MVNTQQYWRIKKEGDDTQQQGTRPAYLSDDFSDPNMARYLTANTRSRSLQGVKLWFSYRIAWDKHHTLCESHNFLDAYKLTEAMQYPG